MATKVRGREPWDSWSVHKPMYNDHDDDDDDDDDDHDGNDNTGVDVAF